jgi:uncharacterized membrane protein
MKENKKFFDNNYLNKGHKRLSNSKQNEAIRNKFHHVLPPIDMMEQYEELNPGTLDKLLDMAKREQNHRHSIDLMAMEKHNKATQLGRAFALVFVAFISITSLMMIIAGSFIVASLFAISAFGCITIISYFYSKNSMNKEAVREKWDNPRNNRNNRNYRKPRN